MKRMAVLTTMAVTAVLLMAVSCHNQAGRTRDGTGSPAPTTRTAGTSVARGTMPFQNPALSIEDRVADLISRMTLEEKVAQMVYTAICGTAFVKGLQGDDPRYLKVAACAKHFVVHSGPEADRHVFNAQAGPKDMYETYLPAFKALVDAKVEAVMCAYNRTNDEPCCGSKTLLGKILCEQWGFRGHIVSDCWAQVDLYEGHKVVATAAEAAALAINSGVNLDCGNTFPHLVEAVQKGLVSEQTIDSSLAILLRTRF